MLVVAAAQGLVQGHAYSVISCLEVDEPSVGSWKMLRVRNPWGKFEWQGDWSDNSEKWNIFPKVR